MKQLVICGAAALCLFASCRSKDEKNLVGTWKVTAEAVDTNKNGVMDAGEREDYSGENYTYTFKKGGDLELKADIFNFTGTWELKNDGDVLNVSVVGLVSQDMKVLELTSSDLKLEYEIDGVKQWEEAKKQ